MSSRAMSVRRPHCVELVALFAVSFTFIALTPSDAHAKVAEATGVLSDDSRAELDARNRDITRPSFQWQRGHESGTFTLIGREGPLRWVSVDR
jgi:hypothetical protein